MTNVHEIVLVDYGSRDDVVKAVRRLTLEFAQLNLVCQDPVSAPEWSRARALNLAAASSRTNSAFYVFTDADMIFPKHWITALVDEDWTLSMTRSRDLSELMTAVVALDEQWLEDHSLPHASELGQGAGMIVPRHWFHKVGGFDEFYTVWGCEDNDLVLRAQWDNLKTRWLQGTWVVHQWHPRNWPTPTQFERVKMNREYLMQRMLDKGPIIRNVKGEE